MDENWGCCATYPADYTEVPKFRSRIKYKFLLLDRVYSMFDNSVWCLRDKRDAIVEIFVIETRRNEKFCCYLLGRVYYPYWKHGIIRGRKRGWKQSWNSEEQSNERLRGEAKALKTDYISRVTRIVGHRLIVDYCLIVRQRRRISTITDAITR